MSKLKLYQIVLGPEDQLLVERWRRQGESGSSAARRLLLDRAGKHNALPPGIEWRKGEAWTWQTLEGELVLLFDGDEFRVPYLGEVS